MKKYLFLYAFAVSFAIISSSAAAQISSTGSPLALDLIDLPTAATNARGEYGIGLRMYPQGGVLSDFSIGVIDRLVGRLYYGGENLIGTGKVNWNPQVGVDLKVRVIEETLGIPAIAIGVNIQGYGGFREAEDRYLIKSRGIYVVGSRNYATTIGDFSVHGGTNFSFEREDKDKDMNFFFGANISIRNVSELLLEFDSAVNDNETTSFGVGHGYLNAGIRFFISEKFNLTFHFKDMLENTDIINGFGREIRLEYRDTFRR
ncbi:hypothetical protein ACFL6I_09915 [candidate division KSB1 bacterium]